MQPSSSATKPLTAVTYHLYDKVAVFHATKQADASASVAVRALLKRACSQLQLAGQLNEHTFPYRLIPSGHLVSFSHSLNTVVVAISLTALNGLGVDLERRNISLSVCHRFFHDNEYRWLTSLSKKADQSDWQFSAVRLWMAKEAAIKADNGSLFKGLSKQTFNTEQLPKLLERQSLITCCRHEFICHDDLVICIKN